MPTIGAFLTIVRDAVNVFGDLFANDPERRHFAEYLTGLIIAEKKTISGINREQPFPLCSNIPIRPMSEGSPGVLFGPSSRV
jgi:hypothetical protein